MQGSFLNFVYEIFKKKEYFRFKEIGIFIFPTEFHLDFYELCVSLRQRAEIVKIHEGTGTLDVLYVAYGNTKTISLSQVRYLHKNFFIDEISIFTCRLFGIQFNDDKALQEASNIFYHYMEDIVASVKTVKQIKVLIKRVERVLVG